MRTAMQTTVLGSMMLLTDVQVNVASEVSMIGTTSPCGQPKCAGTDIGKDKP